MQIPETHRRLRRAREIAADHAVSGDGEEGLWTAWELLHGLSSDEIPEELRPKFDYLRHELERRKGHEMTAREIGFLLGKIQELDLQRAAIADHDSNDREQA
jgi:hypothetical protein